MSSIQYWLATDEMCKDGVFLTVEYAYTPAVPNLKEAGTGLALTPEEPAEVEILSIKDDNGKEYQLSDAALDQIVGDCFKDVERRQCDVAIMQAEIEAEYVHNRRN